MKTAAMKDRVLGGSNLPDIVLHLLLFEIRDEHTLGAFSIIKPSSV